MAKERIYYLDYLRCLACLMVVLMHSPVPEVGHSGILLSGMSFITAPCIGLFFMVSGALLLPTKGDGIDFVKKRFGKVAFPVIVWTIVYWVVEGFRSGWLSPMDYLVKSLSMPFSVQDHSVMWFMYVLVGLYLVAPIISPWLEKASKREIEFFLVLWGVTMCYPILDLSLEINPAVGTLTYLTGYVGYFVLGYYLHKWGEFNIKLILVLFSVPVVAAAICKVAGWNVDFYSMFWYLSIFTVMMCCGWFIIAKRFGGKFGKLNKLAVHFSNCSFGIYLVHIFVMRYFLWRVCEIGALGEWSLVVSFVGTLVISYGLVTLISRLPGSEYIIGYRKR